jgi:surface protein
VELKHQFQVLQEVYQKKGISMGKITNFLLTTVLLVSLIGCNESKTTEANENETLNVSVKLPTSSNQEGKGQFKTVASDVNSILLQVIKSARTVDGNAVAEELLSTQSMTKDASTGIWSVDLILNPDDAPFDFKAMAYATVVTPETQTENTPIFTGETLNITEGNQVIALTETDESINDSVRKLPRLSSVDSTVNSDNSIALTFNLTSQTTETVAYALSSVSDNGAGTECATSLFTPSTGNINFATDTTFSSTLVLDEANCANPKHYLTMTTASNDTMKVPFTIGADGLNISIAKLPIIDHINVVDNETSFDLDVVVPNSDSLTLSYAWSVVEGTGTFDTATAQSTNLAGSDRANALEILIAVTDTSTGASSSIRYQLVASTTTTNPNPPITLIELKAKIAAGEDVTQVNTSEITDMSRLFLDLSFNQAIGKWDVSSVENMGDMFADNLVFNQPIGEWNVSNVTNMSGLFSNAKAFNQPIGEWNVSNVTNMNDDGYGMFGDASSFNQPLEKWDVSSITNMTNMFFGATAFNQDIGSWNVSSITNMTNMFSGATAFNQDISGWNVNNVFDHSYFNSESALATENLPNF